MMTKTSTWLAASELEAINEIKGDISASLWIRRAIQNALSGKGYQTYSPEAATVDAEVATTTTTHPRSDPKETEVV